MTRTCVMRIAPQCLFYQNNPIIVGIDIVSGSLELGMEIWTDENRCLGKVTGMEIGQQQVTVGTAGDSLAIRIDRDNWEQGGMQIDEGSPLFVK